jgi:hypothetical protein
MHLSFSLRPDEYGAAVAAVLDSIAATHAHREWQRRSPAVAGAYFASLLAAFLAAALASPDAMATLALLAVAVLVLHHLHARAHLRLGAGAVGATFDPCRHGRLEVTLDGDRIKCAGAEHGQTWRWTALRRLHDLPDLLVLEFAGFEMLALPKGAFPPGGAEECAAAIARRVPARPAPPREGAGRSVHPDATRDSSFPP